MSKQTALIWVTIPEGFTRDDLRDDIRDVARHLAEMGYEVDGWDTEEERGDDDDHATA